MAAVDDDYPILADLPLDVLLRITRMLAQPGLDDAATRRVLAFFAARHAAHREAVLARLDHSLVACEAHFPLASLADELRPGLRRLVVEDASDPSVASLVRAPCLQSLVLCAGPPARLVSLLPECETLRELVIALWLPSEFAAFHTASQSLAGLNCLRVRFAHRQGNVRPGCVATGLADRLVETFPALNRLTFECSHAGLDNVRCRLLAAGLAHPSVQHLCARRVYGVRGDCSLYRVPARTFRTLSLTVEAGLRRTIFVDVDAEMESGVATVDAGRVVKLHMGLKSKLSSETSGSFPLQGVFDNLRSLQVAWRGFKESRMLLSSTNPHFADSGTDPEVRWLYDELSLSGVLPVIEVAKSSLKELCLFGARFDMRFFDAVLHLAGPRLRVVGIPVEMQVEPPDIWFCNVLLALRDAGCGQLEKIVLDFDAIRQHFDGGGEVMYEQGPLEKRKLAVRYAVLGYGQCYIVKRSCGSTVDADELVEVLFDEMNSESDAEF